MRGRGHLWPQVWMGLQHFLSRDERLGRWWLLLEPVQKQLVMPTRHGLPLQRVQRHEARRGVQDLQARWDSMQI